MNNKGDSNSNSNGKNMCRCGHSREADLGWTLWCQKIVPTYQGQTKTNLTVHMKIVNVRSMKFQEEHCERSIHVVDTPDNLLLSPPPPLKMTDEEKGSSDVKYDRVASTEVEDWMDDPSEEADDQELDDSNNNNNNNNDNTSAAAQDDDDDDEGSRFQDELTSHGTPSSQSSSSCWTRCLLPDDRFSLCGTHLVDGPVAVKLLKFLAVTFGGICLMYKFVRFMVRYNKQHLSHARTTSHFLVSLLILLSFFCAPRLSAFFFLVSPRVVCFTTRAELGAQAIVYLGKVLDV